MRKAWAWVLVGGVKREHFDCNNVGKEAVEALEDEGDVVECSIEEVSE